MSIVILSGGEFGGTEVEWLDGQTQRVMRDDAGSGWVYDRTVSAGDERAEFVGMAQE